MLIVSDFHDFYDTAATFGVDRTVVYNRKTELVAHKSGCYFPQTESTKGVSQIQKFVIGFCGVLYPIISVYKHKTGEHHCFFSAAECLEWAGDGKKLKRSLISMYWGSFNLDDKRQVEHFFNPQTWNTSLLPLFSEYNTPIFFYGDISEERGKNLMLSPKLSTYKFFQVKSPPTAFQEIYMFISGVLGIAARPMIVVSDECKKVSAGHDGEYSFKRPPGPGRWR